MVIPLGYIHRHLWLHRASAPRWGETFPSCCSGRTDPSTAACQKGASPSHSDSTSPCTSAGGKIQTKHQKQRVCLKRKAPAPPPERAKCAQSLVRSKKLWVSQSTLGFSKAVTPLSAVTLPKVSVQNNLWVDKTKALHLNSTPSLLQDFPAICLSN